MVKFTGIEGKHTQTTTYLVHENGGGECSWKYSESRTKSACFSRTFTRTLRRTPCRISVSRSDKHTQLISRSLSGSTCMAIFFTSFRGGVAPSASVTSSTTSPFSDFGSSASEDLRRLLLPDDVDGSCSEPFRNSAGSTKNTRRTILCAGGATCYAVSDNR